MPSPQISSIKDWGWYIVCGMCMGAADLVPGISGGTIAFIMGYYENLINNLKSINRKSLFFLLQMRFAQASELVSLKFLVALVIGVLTSIVVFSQVIDYLLNDEVYRTYLYSGFLGLIFASVIFCAKQVTQWSLKAFIALIFGSVIALYATLFTPHTKEYTEGYNVYIPIPSTGNKPIVNYNHETQQLLNVDNSTLFAMVAKGIITSDTLIESNRTKESRAAKEVLNDKSVSYFEPWIVCCGVIAVSAMLLPGISGSYLLTILGTYPIIIAAIADSVSGIKNLTVDVDSVAILMNLLFGILIGAAIFSRLISWLFNRYHNMTVALLIGFMIGALPTVWPFWSYDYVLMPLKIEKGVRLVASSMVLPEWTSMQFFVSTLIFMLSFFLVMIVESIGEKRSVSKGESDILK